MHQDRPVSLQQHRTRIKTWLIVKRLPGLGGCNNRPNQQAGQGDNEGSQNSHRFLLDMV
jgi:hypothetical protein